MSLIFNNYDYHFWAAIQRIFITLNGTDAHYTMENTLVFGNGDTFEFEFLAPTEAVSVFQLLTDGNANRGFIALLTDGKWEFPTDTMSSLLVDGSSVISGVDNYPLDGKLHKVIATFSQVGEIDFLGQRFSATNFYSGIISNPKATISGVTTAWQLNRLTANTEQSAGGGNLATYVNIDADARELFTFNQSDGGWDGSIQKVVNGGFDTDTDWNKGTGWSIGGGLASSDGTQVGNESIFQGIALNIGDTEKISGNITAVSAGTVRLLADNTTIIIEPKNSPQFVSQIVTVTGSSVGVGFRGDANFVGSVDNVSVKRFIQIV